MQEEKDEVLMENVTPDDLNTEQLPPFVPAPRRKRVLAWVLFAVVLLGVFFWLLGIARPEWTSEAMAWMKGLSGH